MIRFFVKTIFCGRKIFEHKLLYLRNFSEKNQKLSNFLMQIQREKQKKKVGISSFTNLRRQN